MLYGVWTRVTVHLTNFLWRHHRHPWNGWFRLAVWPLAGLTIWFQLWTALALLVLAALLSPLVFPAPRTGEAWMTRAIDGERIFLNRASWHAKAVVIALPLIHLVPLLWALVSNWLLWALYFGGVLLFGRLAFLAWMADLADRSTFDRERGPYQQAETDDFDDLVHTETPGF